MAERGVKLQQLKEQMNGVEDEVFRKFCREIGVANIRYQLQPGLRIVFRSLFLTNLVHFLKRRICNIYGIYRSVYTAAL